MPRFGPIKRVAFIKFMRALGFEGPYSGTKHQFMIKGELRLRLPNPHQGEISSGLLSRILEQAGISRESWEKL
ncbi:MAG: type II toxin-antitoxin system HicA family toxin [Dehalococcoidales bacterium]